MEVPSAATELWAQNTEMFLEKTLWKRVGTRKRVLPSYLVWKLARLLTL